ncbi:MAG: CRISPR-associated protein [Quinella sp. 3Q1]|nr:CRISPR-associated protein [Quinella sp. 3Q1]MBR6888136.1 CRISPR-associated protein [Selenomonadaceae bacterium]
MNSSSVIGKILIGGELVLRSPLLIGDGAGETAENFRDVHVLKNRQGEPFIPGTSLCGVLCDWLENLSPVWTTKIFGDEKEMQSSLQVEDVILNGGEIIARDGVRIDGLTGTVDGDGKYDFEVVERGASGALRLLINLRGIHVNKNFNGDKNYSLDEICAVIARLLRRLHDGIRLGALTTKGFGFVAAENLTANLYDFRNKNDVVAWLTGEKSANEILPSTEQTDASPKNFIVDANFRFNSSFIIRDDNAATLKSRKDFVIPGTSLKGILRHRAEYIFGKLGIDAKILNGLMGNSTDDKKIKSRFIVAESYIAPEDFAEVEHTRNKIDRFTGGTLQGTLFTSKPAYQKNLEPTLKIHFEIRDATDAEAGLATFLLRDLWLGRVALGGEKSVGRGTVSGLSAEINFRGKTYKLGANGKVLIGEKSELENFAAALKNFAGGDGK